MYELLRGSKDLIQYVEYYMCACLCSMSNVGHSLSIKVTFFVCRLSARCRSILVCISVTNSVKHLFPGYVG